MDGCQVHSMFAVESIDDSSHGVMVGIQLNLSREVEDEVRAQSDIILCLLVEGLDLVDQPFEVALEELDGIDQRSIRPKFELLHDVLNGDKVSYVDVPVEVCTVIGRVEVD